MRYCVEHWIRIPALWKLSILSLQLQLASTDFINTSICGHIATMGTFSQSNEASIRTALAFRLDPALGGSDSIEVGKPYEVKRNKQDVEVFEVTGRDHSFTLDDAGFQFLQHTTAITDFQDDEAITSKCYDEIAGLAKDVYIILARLIRLIDLTSSQNRC